MKTNFITESQDTTYVISRDRQAWLFEDGLTFSSSAGPAIDIGTSRNTIVILEGAAEVTGGYTAITSAGRSSTIIVTEEGAITSDGTGMSLIGADAEVDFRGHLEALYTGIHSSSDGFHLNNTGFIAARYGVMVSGAQSAITNDQGGVIQGTISMAGAEGETMWLNNFGTISPRDRNAVYGGDANDIIYNSGDLMGFISLGRGDDMLDTRNGRLGVTHIASGAGNDRLLTSSADYVLSEAPGEGYDIVKSTVSYVLNANVERLELLGILDIDGTGNDEANHLAGNKVDNALVGMDGGDVLDGRRGNDVLTGGEGSDAFIFGSRYDMDTITDFTHGEDTITLSGWDKVGSFRELLKRAEDHGDDLWIIADKDMLVIEGLNKADLHRHDFGF